MLIGRYVIQGGVKGRERLRLLSEVMGPATRELLAEVGMKAGASCLDVGCGGGDVSFDLARAVGREGKVLGVDFDELVLKSARREAQQQGLENVHFKQTDVTNWKADEKYDVVYTRFLLSHLADPLSLLRVLRRQLRPGGVIVVEDVDFRGHFSEPDCPALRRFVDLYTRSVVGRGADPNIGPRLPALLRDAGFSDVKMRLRQPAAFEDGIKLLTCVTLDSIAEVLINDGLINEDEFLETSKSLYAFAQDPSNLIGGPRVFQVWSRVEPA